MSAPKLRFKEFKEDWEEKRISNLVKSLDAGVSVNSEDREPFDNEYSVLKTSCVTLESFDIRERKAVTDSSEINRLKEPLTDNSIIISRMNTPLLVAANAYVKNAPKNTYFAQISEYLKIFKTTFQNQQDI